MKYLQAFLFKKQVEASITKLNKTVVGLGVTNAARIRLAVAHVSGVPIQRWLTKADWD